MKSSGHNLFELYVSEEVQNQRASAPFVTDHIFYVCLNDIKTLLGNNPIGINIMEFVPD